LIRCFKTRDTFIMSLLKNVKHIFSQQHCIHYRINGRIFINKCVWPWYIPMYCLLWMWDANLMGLWWQSCLIPMFIFKHNHHVALSKHNLNHVSLKLTQLAEKRN
jgi:hypothetical protein